MVMKGLKMLLVIYVVTFVIVQIQSISVPACASALTEDNCIANNPPVISFTPLFQGRCCWGGSTPSCIYVPELSSGIINNFQNPLKCGTGVEECNSKKTIEQNDYSDCYSTTVELPYKCCYIGYRYSRRCHAIDVSHTEAFGIFESRFRGIHGLSAEDKIKIECSSSILSSPILLLFSLIFLITL